MRYLGWAFAATILLAGPSHATDNFLGESDIPSELVDPACVSDLTQDWLVDSYKKCVETTDWKPLVEKSKDHFGRTQYVVYGQAQEEGWTLYTTTDSLWEDRIVQLLENTGGTGNFSQIVALPSSDGWAVTKAGDRCNDGNQTALAFGDSFTYARSATPFRLLNFESDVDWRSLYVARLLSKDSNENIEDFLKRMDIPRPFKDYFPYDDIENSAASCVGYVVVSESDKKTDYDLLVTNEFKEITWAKDDSELDTCIADFFTKLMSKYGVPSFHDDYLYLSGEDLKLGLKKLSCPDGSLDEWPN